MQILREHDGFALSLWSEAEERQASAKFKIVGEWTIWVLPAEDAQFDDNEMSDIEFESLPQRSGILSFWNDKSEDIYDENDGRAI